MKKYYVNVKDYQGGSWAMGIIRTIKEWKKIALEWASSDGNIEVYNYIKKHELNIDLLDYINDIWSMEIVELSEDSIDLIVNNYSEEEYKWFIRETIDLLKKIK